MLKNNQKISENESSVKWVPPTNMHIKTEKEDHLAMQTQELLSLGTPMSHSNNQKGIGLNEGVDKTVEPNDTFNNNNDICPQKKVLAEGDQKDTQHLQKKTQILLNKNEWRIAHVGTKLNGTFLYRFQVQVPFSLARLKIVKAIKEYAEKKKISPAPERINVKYFKISYRPATTLMISYMGGETTENAILGIQTLQPEATIVEDKTGELENALLRLSSCDIKCFDTNKLKTVPPTYFYDPLLKVSHCFGLSDDLLLALESPIMGSGQIKITNLGQDVLPWMLREAFGDAGIILKVVIHKDKNGCVTHAIVQYDHPVEAIQAISMYSNRMVLNRRISIELTNELKCYHGPGLALSQKPLRGVRHFIEVQSLRHKIVDLTSTVSKLREEMTVLKTEFEKNISKPKVEPFKSNLNKKKSLKDHPYKITRALKTLLQQGIKPQQIIETLSMLTESSQETPTSDFSQSPKSNPDEIAQESPVLTQNDGLMTSDDITEASQNIIDTSSDIPSNDVVGVKRKLPEDQPQPPSKVANVAELPVREIEPQIVSNPLKSVTKPTNENRPPYQCPMKIPSNQNYQNMNGPSNRKTLLPTIPSIQPLLNSGFIANASHYISDKHTNSMPHLNQQYLDEEDKKLVLFSNLPDSVTASLLLCKLRENDDFPRVQVVDYDDRGTALVRLATAWDADRCIQKFNNAKVDGQAIVVRHL